MAGNIWSLSLKGGLGQTLSKIEFPDIAEIVSTGAQRVIDNIPSTPVAVQDNSGNISTGYAANSDLAEFQVTEVQIPANFAGLEAVMVPTRLMDQLFEITEVDEQDDYVEVVAVHIFYQQRQNTTLWEPIAGNEYTAAAACRNVLDYAMFPMDFAVASDCTDKLPGSELDFARKNIVDAFLNPETGLCKKYDLSLIRDNDRFYCLKNVGFDRGFVVESRKNLLGVQRNENIEDIVTRIAPVGYDPDGKIVWLNHNGKKYVDSTHITDYASPKLGLYDTGLQIGRDGVTADNIQAKLLQEAQKQFSEKEVDLPAVTMTVEFVSLGDTEEYQQYRGLDKVYLFDIIHIKDEERGYQYAAQVIGVEHDILRGMLNSVTIGTPAKWDGVRKVATWQIPEISGDNIRLQTIRAGSFQINAIHSADIRSAAIEGRHFSQSADNHFKDIFAEQLYISNTSEDGLLHTRFEVTEGLIDAEVTRATGAESSLSAQVTVEAGKISQIVSAVGDDGEVTAASIVLAINESTGQSEAKIDAGHVYIGNDKSTTVINGKLNASDVTADYLNAKIATIPTLTGIAGHFSGNVVSESAIIGTGIYIGSSAPYSSVSDAITQLQVVETSSGSGVYKIQKKDFDDSGWVDVPGTFSRATSLGGSWSGTSYTVTASPQGNTISTSVSLDLTGSANIIGASVKNGNTTLDSKGAQLTENVSDKKVYCTLTGGSQTTIGQVSTQATYNAGWDYGITQRYVTAETAGSSEIPIKTLAYDEKWKVVFGIPNSSGVDQFSSYIVKAPSSGGGGTVDVVAGEWITALYPSTGRASITLSPSSGGGESRTVVITSGSMNGDTDGYVEICAIAAVDDATLLPVRSYQARITFDAWSNNKATVHLKTHGGTGSSMCSREIDASSLVTATGLSLDAAHHTVSRVANSSTKEYTVSVSVGGWSNGNATVAAVLGTTQMQTATVSIPAASSWSASYIGIQAGDPKMSVSVNIGGASRTGTVSASGAYNAGVTAGENKYTAGPKLKYWGNGLLFQNINGTYVPVVNANWYHDLNGTTQYYTKS